MNLGKQGQDTTNSSMKFKFLGASLCLVLTSSSLLASTQVFDLIWSGNTDFIETYLGSDSVSGAIATGQLTLDLDALSSPPPTGQGLYVLPDPAFVSLTMTITRASSGNGTFTLADFDSAIFDTLGTPISSFDLSQNLIGQPLTVGGAFGNLDPSNFPAPVGDLVFSSGTGLGNAPTKSSFPFVMLTAGGSGDNLQLVNITPVPEPGTALTVIMTLAGG
jgi:hypothetical protein